MLIQLYLLSIILRNPHHISSNIMKRCGSMESHKYLILNITVNVPRFFPSKISERYKIFIFIVVFMDSPHLVTFRGRPWSGLQDMFTNNFSKTYNNIHTMLLDKTLISRAPEDAVIHPATTFHTACICHCTWM